MANMALFIDLSPVEDVRYAKALYRAMAPLGIRWVGLATTRLAEDEELLRLSGRERVPWRTYWIRVDQSVHTRFGEKRLSFRQQVRRVCAEAA